MRQIPLPQDTPLPRATRLFDPVSFAGLALDNRFAVAPMTRISATADGRPTRRMTEHYRAFAEGGFGLVITEGIYTDKAFAQGYLHQPGLTDDAQVEAWRAVVDAVHAAGGRIFAQLMHAGALSQGNPHRPHSIGPSAVRPKGSQLTIYRGDGPYQAPRAMSLAEIDEAVAGFVDAARRAQAAGFDGVEVHGANGYLLDQYLSEGINLRDDAYGGDFRRRTALTVRTIGEVGRTLGPGYPIGVRISQAKVNDFEHRWSDGEDFAAHLFRAVAEAGTAYVHTTEHEAWRPAFASGGPSLAALAKTHSGLPVIANGSLHQMEKAEEMVAYGHADLVSLGRGALGQEDFPRRLLAGQAIVPFDGAMLLPLADLANQDRHRAGVRTALMLASG